MLDTVVIERHGPAAHLTIQNSNSLNAEDVPLITDLETAVDIALLDPDVHVGVLRGLRVVAVAVAGVVQVAVHGLVAVARVISGVTAIASSVACARVARNRPVSELRGS